MLRNLGFISVGLFCLAAILGRLLPHDLRVPDVPLPAEVPDAKTQQTIDQVDRQFEQAWREAGTSPAPQADEWTVFRRLSLGLTGTVPSLEEIRILQGIAQEDRFSWWLERLLSDRRFSDYLAERLARAYVGVEDGPFLVYRRRRFVTWLSDQIQQHRPYDQIVHELIAGTGIWTDSPAVNFVTVTNDVNDDDQPDEERLAARAARAFLGLRLDCVQCHDDNLGGDWLQSDFQQLAAFFAGTRSSLLGITDTSRDYEFQYLGHDEAEVVPEQVPFAQEMLGGNGARRERLANWITHPDNDAFARAITNRIWALLFGRPLVEPVDNLPLEGPFPPGLELLAQDFVSTLR